MNIEIWCEVTVMTSMAYKVEYRVKIRNQVEESDIVSRSQIIYWLCK